MSALCIDCVEELCRCRRVGSLIQSDIEAGVTAMMGERRVDQEALFYSFSLERHVPADHLVRAIDRFVDLSDLRQRLAPFYSSTGRPSTIPNC